MSYSADIAVCGWNINGSFYASQVHYGWLMYCNGNDKKINRFVDQKQHRQ